MKINEAYNYECDRCGKRLQSVEKVTIFVKKMKEEYQKKEFDLCKNCYDAMVRGIKKGKKNERNDNVG